MTTPRPLGFWAAGLCAIALVQSVAVVAFLGMSALWFQVSLLDDLLWVRLVIGWTTLQLVLLLLSFAVLGRARALQRGARGRARVLGLATTGVLHALLTSVSVGIILWAAFAARGHVLGGTVASLLFGLTHLAYPTLELEWLRGLYEATSTLQWVTLGLLAVLGSSCWFLVSADRREQFWRVFDIVIAGLFVTVSLALPLAPVEGQSGSLAGAVVRVVVTTLFATRLALRSVGPLLSLFERIGFRSMVAARHLRAKKTGFLAASGTLSVLAVAVSSCMLISVLSVMGGFRADLKKKILGNHAHIVVDRAFAQIDDWQPILDKARETQGVRAATPYLETQVMVSSLSSRAGAVLRGIDATSVSDVTDLGRNMTHGKLDYLNHPERILEPEDEPGQGSEREKGGAIDAMLEALKDDKAPPDKASEQAKAEGSDAMPGLIVGQELARALRLVVGDRVTIVSPRGELGPTGPVPRTKPFRIAGIFYSGMYEYDMKHAYVSLPVAQRFLNAGEGVSGLEVKVDDVDQAPALAASLATSLGNGELRVRDWKTLNQQLFGALALEKLAMFITLGIAILIAGFSVFGTLTLLVQEKRREVGILKAMGTSARGVIRIFVLEGLLIGAAGGLLGLGLGFVLTFAAEHFGIRMNPEVYYIDKLPVKLDPTEFALVGAATVVVCLAATLFPAYQASRVRPVDALRYD
ncbi:MAG: ABC transporter permease [Myxococcota bacterium]